MIRPGTTDRVYLPYDGDTQPHRAIEGYPRSQRRTPREPFIARPVTLSERTGPFGIERKLRMGPDDLARPVPGAPPAIGQYVRITGRVLDEDGIPVDGAILELWQANAAGKYIHEFDQNDAPVDPNFVGAARLQTDADGRFTFHTIKPGAYPVPHSTWEWRAPHIHVSIFGQSWMSRMVTQLFFPGEPLNDQDLLLNAIPSAAARQRLIIVPLPTVVRSSRNVLEFEHQFVLRGKQRTPSLTDSADEPQSTSGPFANMTTGPFFPPQFLDPGCDDAGQFDGGRAQGQRILLTGRILEEGLGPTVNTIIETWQADARGVFRHPSDPRSAEVDPGFCGWARAFTDTDGWYRLHAVMPGSYRTDAGAPRCPHINVMLLASGILRPLQTTVFFGDGCRPADDPILSSLSERHCRLLFAAREPSLDSADAIAYRFDIVLRGEEETPFFLD